MVIFNKLPHLEVSVQVDGANVQEYDDDEEITVKPGLVGEHQAGRTVSKFVEAVDGAEFCVRCLISPQYIRDSPNILVRAYVDGNLAQGKVVGHARSSILFEGKSIRTSHSSRSGDAEKWVMQKFRFSRLDISSEETRHSSLEQERKEAEKIGTIEVKIWRVSETTTVIPLTCNQLSAASNRFHEKAFKGEAKTHNVSYSAKTPIPAQRFVDCKILDGKDYPIAIYKFKYRSREALKQLLIIERTPEPDYSPAPNPGSSVDLGNLTDAQQDRLKAFLRNEGIAADRVSNTPERKVKRERDNGEGSSDQARRKKSKTTEIVDLTADSDEDE
ncbi:hypothetical protein MFRU_002g03560 [Monilinia fructicola]|nr:hypothetical protein MFRU_002g03560 [Monilinia fructicola]